MTDRAVYGLVLAGGKSRRMGVDKALLMHDGESQLARAVRLLERVTDEAFVSTRADQQDDPERAKFKQIVDRYDGIGPVAGILSAMDTYPDVDWLVVACDLPNLSESVLTALLPERRGGHPFVAYRSVHNDLPEPLCAVYGRGSDKLLRGFVAEGIHCPRKMMINSDTRLLDQSERDALDNINTPDDLARTQLQAGP